MSGPSGEETRPQDAPPGNSLEPDQGGQVAAPGEDLVTGLQILLERIAEELSYNDAKGAAPYRLGMHDGLRFAEEALVTLLRRHGHALQAPPRRPVDA